MTSSTARGGIACFSLRPSVVSSLSPTFASYPTLRCIENWPQEVVENQVVLLLGCGGVGANFALALVRMGVKKIFLIDYDTVDATNLNRQILYTKEVGCFWLIMHSIEGQKPLFRACLWSCSFVKDKILGGRPVCFERSEDCKPFFSGHVCFCGLRQQVNQVKVTAAKESLERAHNLRTELEAFNLDVMASWGKVSLHD
jgi:hypothetical protein